VLETLAWLECVAVIDWFTVKRIAETAGLSQSCIRQHLTKCEQLQLVKVKVYKRRTLWQLTPYGRDRAERGAA
jgi:DNA-binding HxlR family transcriptional regulator